MLPSIEMIVENVDEEIPLVIIKTLEIQSCVRVFHFFQDSWQPKLGDHYLLQVYLKLVYKSNLLKPTNKKLQNTN